MSQPHKIYTFYLGTQDKTKFTQHRKDYSEATECVRRKGSIKAEMWTFHGSGFLSGSWKAGHIYIGTEKGRRKSIADVENSDVTRIATERGICDIIEKTILSGATWKQITKLGSLNLPGKNGELLEVCVMRYKVVK